MHEEHTSETGIRCSLYFIYLGYSILFDTMDFMFLFLFIIIAKMFTFQLRQESKQVDWFFG